jgi:hypothetical protein
LIESEIDEDIEDVLEDDELVLDSVDDDIRWLFREVDFDEVGLMTSVEDGCNILEVVKNVVSDIVEDNCETDVTNTELVDTGKTVTDEDTATSEVCVVFIKLEV